MENQPHCIKEVRQSGKPQKEIKDIMGMYTTGQTVYCEYRNDEISCPYFRDSVSSKSLGVCIKPAEEAQTSQNTTGNKAKEAIATLLSNFGTNSRRFDDAITPYDQHIIGLGEELA